MSNQNSAFLGMISPHGCIDEELHKKLKKIKLLISDVDGVLSDGKIYLTNNGDEIKSFNVRDGFGIVALRKYLNIEFAVITGRSSKIVENRLKSLGSNYIFQGVTDKVPYIHELMQKLNLKAEEIAYIGDDVIDIPVFNEVGVSFCPKDSHVFVLNRADYISHFDGGNGAVREVWDLILWAQDKLEAIGASI